MEPLGPQDLLSSLHRISFDQKWELLKPTIERLYNQMTLPEIIKTIRDEHGFDAA